MNGSRPQTHRPCNYESGGIRYGRSLGGTWCLECRSDHLRAADRCHVKFQYALSGAPADTAKIEPLHGSVTVGEAQRLFESKYQRKADMLLTDDSIDTLGLAHQECLNKPLPEHLPLGFDRRLGAEGFHRVRLAYGIA